MSTRNIVPRADLEGSLGTQHKRWEYVYASGIYLAADPSGDMNAATKQYVDNAVSGENLWDRVGAYITPHYTNDNLDLYGYIDMNGRGIVDLVDPSGNQDAATKIYVDSAIEGENHWDLTGNNLHTYISTVDVVPNASGTQSVGTTVLAFGEGNFDNLQVNSTPSGAFDATNKSYVDAAVSTANEFIELTDTPSSYSGMSASGVRVTSGADGLEFYDLTPPVTDHDLLNNLEWSVAGHTIDADIVPEASGTSDVGTISFAFASGVFDGIQINNNPVGPLDAVNKDYVDSAVEGENLWDRTGSQLTTHNVGDDVRIDGQLGVGRTPTCDIDAYHATDAVRIKAETAGAVSAAMTVLNAAEEYTVWINGTTGEVNWSTGTLGGFMTVTKTSPVVTFNALNLDLDFVIKADDASEAYRYDAGAIEHRWNGKSIFNYAQTATNDIQMYADNSSTLFYADVSDPILFLNADETVSSSYQSQVVMGNESDDDVLRILGQGSFKSGGAIRFGDSSYVFIEEDTDDHLRIYADGGMLLESGFDMGFEAAGNSYFESGYDFTFTGATWLGIDYRAQDAGGLGAAQVAFHIIGNDSDSTSIWNDRYSNTSSGSTIENRKYRGTASSPSGVWNGDYLGTYSCEGFDGTNTVTGFNIQAYTTEVWSGSNRGTEVEFNKVLTGSNSTTAVLYFEGDGTLSTGITNYETLVTSDDDFPNKKYVDDAIAAGIIAEDFWDRTGTSLTPKNSGDDLVIDDLSVVDIAPSGNIVPTASGTQNVGTIAFAFASGVFDGVQLNNDPVGPLDATNKQYVDAKLTADQIVTLTNQASYSIDDEDIILVTANTTNTDIVLPSPSVLRKKLIIKLVDTEDSGNPDVNRDVTLTPSTGTIDGGSVYYHNAGNGSAVTIIPDGTSDWKIINYDPYMYSESGIDEEDVVFLGARAGQSWTRSSGMKDIVFIGNNCGRTNTGTSVVGVGEDCLEQNSGDNVVAAGEDAGRRNTGSSTVMLGRDAGWSNDGGYAVLVGRTSGRDNQGDTVNLIGRSTGYGNTGEYVDAIGYTAARNNTGDHVVALGRNAAYSNTANSRLYIHSSSADVGPNALIYGEFDTPKLDINGDLTANYDVAVPSGHLTLASGVSAHELSDDTTLSDDSSSSLPTEHAVKTYIDNAVSGEDLWNRTGTLLTPKNSGDDLVINDMSVNNVDASGVVHINTATPSGLIIGNGTADADYSITFDGETNDGVVTWMEDEARFDFDSDVKVDGTRLSMAGAVNSNWSSNWNVLSQGMYAFANEPGGTYPEIVESLVNAYYTGSKFKYATSGYAGRVRFYGDEYQIYHARSGSADNDITWRQSAMFGSYSGGSNVKIVFNDNGRPGYFRVESDTDSNLAYFDFTNSRVGILTGSPDYELQVNGTVAPEASGQNLGTDSLRWEAYMLNADIEDSITIMANEFNVMASGVTDNNAMVTKGYVDDAAAAGVSPDYLDTSSDYIITDTDGYAVIYVTTGGAAKTITLPTLADNDKRTVTVKQVDPSGTVTIDGEGGETIDGQLTRVIDTQYDAYKVQATTTEWRII